MMNIPNKREYDKMSITKDIVERENIIRQFHTTGFFDRNEAIEKILSLQYTDADMAIATAAKQKQYGGVNLYQAGNNLIAANIQFQIDFLRSGFDNYELSVAELNALREFETINWKSFNLEKLFGKSTRGKRLKSADRIVGDLPFVTAGEASEGISAHIGNDVEVFNENTTTIDMFGSAKYRNYKYGADDHIAVVHTDKLPMKASIFVTSAIHKASHTGKFDYGHNFYAKDADALDIMLPEKNGNPDYAYMATLISAVQKLVIKDVVKYSDAKISATKEVVQHQ